MRPIYGYSTPIGGALGAIENGLLANPSDPPSSYDAVTVFRGENFTGARWEITGGAADVDSSGATRQEKLGLWSGSVYVPPGFNAALVEDQNFGQRHRRRFTRLTGPAIVPQLPHPTMIIAVQDTRTPEDKARMRQLLALQKEQSAAAIEQQLAEQTVTATQATANALAMQQQAAAQREAQRSLVMQQQSATAAQQEVASMAAAQRAATQAVAAQGRGTPKWVLPTAGAAAAILLLLTLARR